jgi:hypothetical protein
MDKELIRTLARSTLGPVAEVLVTLRYSLRRRVAVNQLLQAGNNRQADFPIDLVYTWVEGNDPSWQADKLRYQQDLDNNPLASQRSAHASCYKSRDELLYSLRSVALFAGFVNRIHIVTAGQTPAWLNNNHPKINLVAHKDIFADQTALPTFNANAIESRLHHISGLSEHFLYLNDDIFFGKQAAAHDYFEPDGKPVFYQSELGIPDSPPLKTDTGYEWGIKNARDLLRGEFALPPVKKLLHAPFALRKSLLAELETRYPSALQTTAGNRFRQMTDVGLVYSLFPCYAALRGAGIFRDPPASGYNNTYLNIGSPFLRAALKKLLLTRSCHTFCINESISTGLDTSGIDKVIARFLQAYYPQKCEYEK